MAAKKRRKMLQDDTNRALRNPTFADFERINDGPSHRNADITSIEDMVEASEDAARREEGVGRPAHGFKSLIE